MNIVYIMPTKFFLTLIVFAMSLSTGLSQSSKPQVLILSTGGTIASRTDAPLIDGPELVQAVPELLDYADIQIEQFVKIGSSKMTPEVWLRLVKRIHKAIEDNPNLSCIIITHGTDTMEETAFFLNLTHRSNTTLVLVGSMRSSNEVSADGPANLINAVRVGISGEAKGKGVLVVLNENISSGRDLWKRNNRRVNTFESPDFGFLGFADPDKVVFYREPLKPHTMQSEFDVLNIEELPKVDIVRDFAGFEQGIFDYFLKRESQGLVLSTFAGGRSSQGIVSGIRALEKGDKPTVISSGVRGGRIFGTQRGGSPVIISNDLPPNKARILLMLALTLTSNPVEIQKIFDRY